MRNVPLGPARSISASSTLPAVATAALVSLDLAFHEHHRGIVVALSAVPALSLVLSPDRSARRPLIVGALALGGAVVSAAVDWRDRPFVLLATFLNIVLLTLISHRLFPRLQPTPSCTKAPPTAIPLPPPPSLPVLPASTPPEPPQAATARTYQIGELRLTLRSVPQANRTTLVADLCDARESPYGTRVLVADLMGKDDATRIAGDELLGLWRALALTESSLGEIARRLDAGLAERTDRFAKALLITMHDNRGELVCCGHAPPVLISDSSEVRELNVLTPLPPLGLFHLVPNGCAVYATSFTVSSTKRLLLHTDGIDGVANAQGRPFPLHDRARAHEGCAPAALLDALVADLSDHVGGDLSGLRDEALLLLLQAERHEFRHFTTAFHTAPASSQTEVRPVMGLEAAGHTC